jgi:hypothetical protein
MRKLIARCAAQSGDVKSAGAQRHLPKREGLVDLLGEQIVMALLFRLNQQAIEAPTQTPREQVARAALHTMTLVASYATGAD